jgi:transcription antitermination factor NusG
MAVARAEGDAMDVHGEQWPWFAIMVRANREKSANGALERAGYECFLPLCKAPRRWSDRTKMAESPLFPGYLFCRFNSHDRLPILMKPDVIKIVGMGKTPTPVNDTEIASLRCASGSEVPIVQWPYLEAGDVVRIEHGPLRGLAGIVIKVRSGLKLVLSVDLLQRSVAVEIDSSWISARSPFAPDTIRHPSNQLEPHWVSPVQA